MPESTSTTANLNNVNQDVKTLLRDAQTLFHSAAALSGEKADELRSRGMQLLDKATLNAQQVQESAVVAGKKAAACTEAYVKENPWQAIAAAVSVGLLAGALLLRK